MFLPKPLYFGRTNDSTLSDFGHDLCTTVPWPTLSHFDFDHDLCITIYNALTNTITIWPWSLYYNILTSTITYWPWQWTLYYSTLTTLSHKYFSENKQKGIALICCEFTLFRNIKELYFKRGCRDRMVFGLTTTQKKVKISLLKHFHLYIFSTK
jgi:hypothetical protein